MTKLQPYDLPPALHEFGMFPKRIDHIAELAQIAEAEEWNYHNTVSDRELPILVNYLRYTYERLAEEKKISISGDESRACFNTGLVTSNQEEIFAFFTINNLDELPQFWHFSKFCRKGEFELNSFPALPEIAHYFDNPSDLILDCRKEIRVNVEHILEDNFERFPDDVKALDKFAIQNLIKGAVDRSLERVRRNYKTAIPQYYRGNVQLLLPLSLMRADRADLALVVERYSDFYRAATCLTLDMAYNNARQLARPDRDWLKP